MHDHVIDSKRKPQLQKEYADYVEQLGNYGHPIKGPFTYDVTDFLTILHPPSPLCHNSSQLVNPPSSMTSQIQQLPSLLKFFLTITNSVFFVHRLWKAIDLKRFFSWRLIFAKLVEPAVKIKKN